MYAKKIAAAVLAAVLILTGCASVTRDAESGAAAATTEQLKLSNAKQAWFFKRGVAGAQPTFDLVMKAYLDKYSGIYVGKKDKPYIYLTFDQGYENGNTAKILDILKSNNVKAAFFITGGYFDAEKPLIKRMLNEGHTVGNHTQNHPSMADTQNDKLEREIMQLDQSFAAEFGAKMKYLRPPRGEFSERTLELSKSLGYTTVMWSFAHVDWEVKSQPSVQKAIDSIVSGAHNGEVMLLHSVSTANTSALDTVIRSLKQDGYEFKSLDEMR